MGAPSIKGWWLVGATALIVGAMTASILAVYGPTQAGFHALLRATARTSLVLFLGAFVASPVTGGVAEPLRRLAGREPPLSRRLVRVPRMPSISRPSSGSRALGW